MATPKTKPTSPTQTTTSAARFDALGASTVIVEISRKGKILSASPALLSLLARDADEVVGTDYHSHVAVGDATQTRVFVRQAADSEVPAADYQLRTADGSTVFVHLQHSAFVEGEGPADSVLAVGFDVSANYAEKNDLKAQVRAINKVQASIEFALDGTIQTANANFLDAVGYTLEEVVGKHHSMFAEDAYRRSPEYAEFWAKLNRGEFDSGEYKRLGKGGKEVWIQASYNPILDAEGTPIRVVKFAIDVTGAKLQAADFHGQISAIGKSQAVIEFDMDGTVRTANDNFLGCVGYQLDEVVGKHHSLFVSEEERKSAAYAEFWAKLNRGQFDSGEYKRLGKGGKDVWIQASYNPIFDMNGKAFKVIKYATDVSADKLRNADFRGQLDAIGKSQAVIEFDMDGTIRGANSNFLSCLGYSHDEVVGKHHSMFAESNYRNSPEYSEFWETLNRGEFSSGEYKRVGKGGKEVWIQASYNPIFDMNGKPFKVVKYATDVTEAKIKTAEHQGQLDAIDKAQAAIHFNMDGSILHANDNFLAVTGYALDEVVGLHHRIFVDSSEHGTAAYREFWAKLNRGEFDTNEYRRIAKDGSDIWIQASYNPIFDLNGKPFKVVKFATDVTDRVKLQAEIRSAVSETIRVANALSDGDLTTSMEGSFDGQFVELQSAVNGFINSMGAALAKAKDASGAVAEASGQLKNASAELAKGAGDQSEACQVSAQALAETSSMVASTADNANRANELVQATAATADEGIEKMRGLTEAMVGISQSSSEIAKIIKVIDEIAFQTNLLAVNAAVEAARAGKHGRGFAVVAQEVRSLAGRSAKAAQATAELIEKSTTTVADGVRHVEDTSVALNAIQENVQRVKDLVGEISAASDEQSRGVAEITHAMNDVNTAAQSARQQTSQLAGSARELGRQSDLLKEAVSRFSLREATGGLNAAALSELSPSILAQLAGMLGVSASALTGANDSTPVATSEDDGRDKRGFGGF